MKKGKQILAIIGIILLVVLYLSTLVCAITDNTGTMKMFKASIFATFVIPVLIWLIRSYTNLRTRNNYFSVVSVVWTDSVSVSRTLSVTFPMDAFGPSFSVESSFPAFLLIKI